MPLVVLSAQYSRWPAEFKIYVTWFQRVGSVQCATMARGQHGFWTGALQWRYDRVQPPISSWTGDTLSTAFCLTIPPRASSLQTRCFDLSRAVLVQMGMPPGASSLQIICLEPGLCHRTVGYSWSRWEYHRVASSLQIKCFEPHVGGSAPHGLMLSHIFQAWLTIATRRQNFRMYLGVGLARERKSLDPSHSHAAPGLALIPPGGASLALRYHCDAPLSLDIISVGQP